MSFKPYSEIKPFGVVATAKNNTGQQIDRVTPIRINGNGDMDLINVSIEAQIVSVSGLTDIDVGDGLSGNYVTFGKVINIDDSFNFGDTIYISKIGGLTNVKPSAGIAGFVAGDFVVSVGVVAKNLTDSLIKDLILNVDVVGQL